MLSAFEAFFLPSFSEGLPGSVLEAMAAGVPVVGSHVRGIKEVVKNGDTGLFFSSNNDSELADSLKNLLDSKSLARSLSANAFDYVQKMHSKDVWINKISDIFCLKS